MTTLALVSKHVGLGSTVLMVHPPERSVVTRSLFGKTIKASQCLTVQRTKQGHEEIKVMFLKNERNELDSGILIIIKQNC